MRYQMLSLFETYWSLSRALHPIVRVRFITSLVEEVQRVELGDRRT